jgi:adenylate cyclase
MVPMTPPSIAVLAFVDMSGDPEQESFVDGIVEEITTALSKVRWFFVVGRASSFAYKGRPMDVKQVGRELGVPYVIEGSVRKSGNRIRIAAQPRPAPKPGLNRYDQDMDDFFAV